MTFDIDQLGQAIEEAGDDIIFALLTGSAREGTVKAGSDLDIAIYIEDGADKWKTINKVCDICDRIVPGVTADIGILNNAEPVYRFEALKGHLLFTRDQDTWAAFFSLSCREYESQMVSFERQRRYRLEAVKDEIATERLSDFRKFRDEIYRAVERSEKQQ